MVDLVDPDTYRDGLPLDEFARLRAQAPVSWHDEPRGAGYWAVTRHRDVVAVLRNPGVYSSWRGGALVADPPVELLAMLRQGIMHRDPPDHGRLRALATRAFNPRRMDQLARRVAALAGQLVAAARAAGGCDFATDIAEQLPLFVICERLGVPVADRERLYGLTARMLRAAPPTSTPNWPGYPSRRATRSSRSCRRPTGTRPSSNSRTGSTRAVRPTRTSRSASDRTTASVRRWPGSKPGVSSVPCCRSCTALSGPARW